MLTVGFDLFLPYSLGIVEAFPGRAIAGCLGPAVLDIERL